MLVLSRNVGERLVIGDNITIIVSKIVGNRVTIGIEAPKDVKVMREELTDSKLSDTAGVPSQKASTESPAKPVNRSKKAPLATAYSLKQFKDARGLHRQVG
jgi:carbon storage regulator